jgi:hypothetical protein
VLKKLIFSVLAVINIALAEEITIIGDSLTVGAEKYIRYYIPNAVIDAKVGRKFQEAMERVLDLESKGLLKDIVVIALGTNGYFSVEEGLKIIDYLQSRNKKVVFVNAKVPRWWESDVNNTYEELKRLRPNIRIIDWRTISYVICSRNDIPECFRKDGYHLTDMGSNLFSLLIYKYTHEYAN